MVNFVIPYDKIWHQHFLNREQDAGSVADIMGIRQLALATETAFPRFL